MAGPPVDAPAASTGRGCGSAVGLALLVPGGALLLAWLSAGLSWWSCALGLGIGALGLGLLLRHVQRALAARLLAAGALLVLGPWLARVLLVRGSEQMRLTSLPGDTGPSLLSRLYPEPDGALAAARLIGLNGGLRDPQGSQFPTILEQAYARIEPAAAMLPTPAIATYLGLQGPGGFDTIVIRPPAQRVAPDAALIFLHGYAGNFHVYCWELAQAAAAANLLTLCPSLGSDGAWWQPQGEQTLQVTLEYAHAIGMNRIYLAGLSNGAAGASVLALKQQQRLAGLVLISGGRAAAPPPLPVLVVQGATDRMMPAAGARAYAAGHNNARYYELPGGHLILLSEHHRVRPVIAEFLSALEKRATSLPQH